MNRTIGIETQSDNFVKLMIDMMVQNGQIAKDASDEEKRTKASKQFIDRFMVDELKIDRDEWKSVPIDKIHTGRRTKNNKTI